MIVVSKGVSRKAAERNLLKRRIRSAAGFLLKKPAADYIIIARPGILSLSFQTLKKEMQKKI